MFMSVVRQKGIDRSPDIRTRTIVPQWACQLSISYASILDDQSVINLLAASGFIQGIGGLRVEKGSGSYGRYSLVSADDKKWNAVVKSGGRAAQIAALKNPEYYDDETRDLYQWFNEELKLRSSKKSKANGHAVADDEDIESSPDFA